MKGDDVSVRSDSAESDEILRADTNVMTKLKDFTPIIQKTEAPIEVKTRNGNSSKAYRSIQNSAIMKGPSR
jgi:hypothetical protein